MIDCDALAYYKQLLIATFSGFNQIKHLGTSNACHFLLCLVEVLLYVGLLMAIKLNTTAARVCVCLYFTSGGWVRVCGVCACVFTGSC